MGPKPGMFISRLAVSSFRAGFATERSQLAIASSRFRSCNTGGANASERQRATQRFRSRKALHEFCSVHAQVYNHFNQVRDLG